MPRIRIVTARLYTTLIYAQLFVMSCRNKLIKLLLPIPVTLLPKAVLTGGDLADMVRNVEQDTGTAQSSSLTIVQFIGVALSLESLIDLKEIGRQGRMRLAGCTVSIIIRAVLVAGPETISRGQRQLGISSTSIG